MENFIVFSSFKLSVTIVFIIVIAFSMINICHYDLEVNLYYHSNILPLSNVANELYCSFVKSYTKKT